MRLFIIKSMRLFMRSYFDTCTHARTFIADIHDFVTYKQDHISLRLPCKIKGRDIDSVHLKSFD